MSRFSYGPHGVAEAASKQLSLPALQQKVLEWQPDMEAAGSEGQLAAEVASSLRPAAIQELDKAIKRLCASGSEVGALIFTMILLS